MSDTKQKNNACSLSELFKSKPDHIRLLLVDDEKGFADILSKRLSKRNFEVTTALSGAEALQALRKADFDIAVLDLKMEDMDGIEVLKIFKKMCPSMEIIMLTGHGSEQAAREGLSIGAFAYLTKPCDLDDLINMIRQALKRGDGSNG
ncbi:MAG: response regulator [Deltaproteobacteria bacterium]|nr:MAG: response regulator [Deltaproteobacteria bacterium]